jgi:hypothetical protein
MLMLIALTPSVSVSRARPLDMGWSMSLGIFSSEKGFMVAESHLKNAGNIDVCFTVGRGWDKFEITMICFYF